MFTSPRRSSLYGGLSPKETSSNGKILFHSPKKRTFRGGDPTLKGTPPRAPLHTDLPLSLSLSPPGFLISKCCFPTVKAKPSKAKRVRTIFTSEQLARLEKEFARQQYMVGTERCQLASSLRLTEEQVSPLCSISTCPHQQIQGGSQTWVPMVGTWTVFLSLGQEPRGVGIADNLH